MQVTLNLLEDEYRHLMQPKWTRGKVKGGFQRLADRLQRRTIRATRQIVLDHDDLADIRRCAQGYGSGGWQTALKLIFGRLLGENLDKYAPPPPPQQTALNL